MVEQEIMDYIIRFGWRDIKRRDYKLAVRSAKKSHFAKISRAQQLLNLGHVNPSLV